MTKAEIFQRAAAETQAAYRREKEHLRFVMDTMRREDWAMRLERAAPLAEKSVSARIWSGMGSIERANLVERFAVSVLAAELAERELER
jgi:hypothetical protein